MLTRVLKKDVVVIGSGCAGMIASLEAAKTGADVLLVDRGTIGVGTNSAISNGVFAGPTLNYGKKAYVQDTLEAGKGLNKRAFVKYIAEQSESAFSLLRSYGIDLVEFHGGYSVKSNVRDRPRGFTLVNTLKTKVQKTRSIELFSRFYVTDLIKYDNSIQGIIGIIKGEQWIVVLSSSVVLATGGASAIYLRNDNQNRSMGQGYYLAAKAGLKLWDMEFIQFYPLVLAQSKSSKLLIYPPYPKEGRILNETGEDILQKHGIGDPNNAIKCRRDELSAVLFEEGLKGPVYMDYTRIPDSMFKKGPLSVLLRKKVNFSRAPFAVSPAAHFIMGGINTDNNGQTSIPGLFACGEVLWGVHGANRMRGNALTECAVTGMISGRSAAEYASTHTEMAAPKFKSPKIIMPTGSSSPQKIKALLKFLRLIAWKHAGVVRNETGIKQAIGNLNQIKQNISQFIPSDIKSLITLEDLKSAMFILQTILTASLFRQETRGAFIRSDFPTTIEDKSNNSCIYFDGDNDTISVEYVQMK